MTNGRSGREELVGYGSGEALLANGLHAIGKPQPDRKKRLLVDSFSRRQKSFIVYRRGKKKKKNERTSLDCCALIRLAESSANVFLFSPLFFSSQRY